MSCMDTNPKQKLRRGEHLVKNRENIHPVKWPHPFLRLLESLVGTAILTFKIVAIENVDRVVMLLVNFVAVMPKGVSKNPSH